jgi:nitrogen PTS system EIIA component
MNAVARYLLPQDVCLDLDITSKRQLLHAVGQHMQRQHQLSPDDVVLSLSRREQAGSTALGEGVAIPHARIERLDRIYALYVRPRSPIPFDAPDGKPVSDILVLLVPKPATEEHLAILGDAMHLLSDRRFRKRLHASTNQLEAVEVFRQAVVAGVTLR